MQAVTRKESFVVSGCLHPPPTCKACTDHVPIAQSIVPCDLIPGLSPMKLPKYLTVVTVMMHHSDRACFCLSAAVTTRETRLIYFFSPQADTQT